MLAIEDFFGVRNKSAPFGPLFLGHCDFIINIFPC
jgi:hypothetical protein